MSVGAVRFSDVRGLYARITGSRHYHLGLFAGVSTDSELGTALDRTALLGLAGIADRGRVLDVGCGLGGTARLLHARGFRVVGVDPCRASIAVAARWSAAGRDAPRFRCVTLADCGRTAGRGTAFDAIVQIETLPHLPHLDEVAAAWRALAPRGRVLLTDLFATRPLPFDRAPFRTADQLRAAARRFDLELDEDLSAAAFPTFDLLLARLEERDGAKDRELAAQLVALRDAVAHGDLVYRHLVLRCRD